MVNAEEFDSNLRRRLNPRSKQFGITRQKPPLKTGEESFRSE